MIAHLSDAIIRRTTPPAEGYTVIWDDAIAGFGARITSSGIVAFILNYRVKSTGRERRVTIGRFPSWSTTTARAKAAELRRAIDSGADPRGDAETERAAPTIADLITRFRAEHLPQNRSHTVTSYEQMLRRHIEPALRHHKVADLKYADAAALHRKVTNASGDYAANRTIGVLSSMFVQAQRWGWRDDNPCKHVQRNPESRRKRYLTGDELARLTEALTTHTDRQAADVIRLLLLTGARCGEIFSMQWKHIDLGTGLWSKPASGTKQKQDHVVPLSAPGRRLLSDIAKKSPSETFVFPSTGRTGHIVDINRAWREVCRDAKITGLRVHDLRHSFASQLVSSGASLPLIGQLLGHSSPSTTARYAHMFTDPQRAAVEKVAAIIENAGKPAKEPVVFLKGGRHGR